jgi:hypothetical protein
LAVEAGSRFLGRSQPQPVRCECSPFLTTTQLSKRPFPLRRLHNWYMTTSSLGVMNITFEILGNSFYSGTRIELIDFEDLWFMFHWKWLDMNLLVVFCLQVNSNSFNFLNASLVFSILIHFLGMISCYVGCNSWTL